MDISLSYRPTEKQRMFHASEADEVLYGGAAGGGKSYAICWDAFMRCMRWPGTHAYLFRRTYPELEMTLVRTMQTIVPKELGKYTASAHEMRFLNGSTAHFCHLSNEGEGLLKYQGAEIHWLYFDELTHFTKPMYDYLRTRLRAEKRLGITPCVRAASNPGGPGHAWVKARFVDSTYCGERIREMPVKSDILGSVAVRRVQYIPATARDNPHITQDYVIELEQKPRALRDALLYGRWDAFDGQAFPEFTDDPQHYEDGLFTHVIRPFDIPYHWPRYVSFDHGYTRPFSFGVWTVDEDGRVYRYKELYGCVPGEANTGVMLAPGEIAERLAELLEPEIRDGIRVAGIADPAIWDRSRGMSVEEQIRSAFSGVAFSKGDNTRLPGKMQLHERLKFDEEGRPMLYVFANCRDFIRTIPSLTYDARRPEDIDTAAEDHIYDETRYFLMSRPIAPRPQTRRRAAGFDPLAG
ncbi:MAG: phage terminase large subunit [Clostridia bacterium]|nr:phage terminase large subunit [Clostridia bacterium]